MQPLEPVAYRALALTALLTRTQLEHGVKVDRSRMPGWRRIQDETTAWMQKEGIDAALSDAERELLARPLGDWSDDNIFECVWRSEALVALLWALGKLPDMPPYGRRVDEALLNPQIPALKPAAPWLESSALRADDDLRAARQTAEFWLWRGRTELMRRRGTETPAGETYEESIGRAVELAQQQGAIQETIGADVAVDGVAFSKLEDADFANAYSVALERLYAMNWVCGYAEDWDATPTET